jgi:hypothetical protein
MAGERLLGLVIVIIVCGISLMLLVPDTEIIIFGCCLLVLGASFLPIVDYRIKKKRFAKIRQNRSRFRKKKNRRPMPSPDELHENETVCGECRNIIQGHWVECPFCKKKLKILEKME